MPPFEIVYNYNPFDIYKKLNKNVQETQFNRTLMNIKKDENIRNKHLEYQYKINDKVFKRNFSPDKLENKWKGPFKLTKILQQNVVEIQENKKLTTQNIKNLKPYFYSERAECQDQNDSKLRNGQQ